MLYEDGDTSARWLASEFAAREIPLLRVTGTDLALATRWEHRIGPARTTFRINLEDGRVLDSEHSGPVLNRLSFLPQVLLLRLSVVDRDYAQQEFFSLFLSWMSALPSRMFNRPTPQGLMGNWRHPSAWTALGAQAGLPVKRWSQSASTEPEATYSARSG